MQKYRQKTPLAFATDKVFRVFIALAAGLGWFVWLWGVNLTSLLAGTAMGVLLWQCARLFGKKTMKKREAQLRRTIGGELALGRLLVMKPRHAAFQAALWMQPVYPIIMQRTVEWGVTGTWKGKSVLIRLIAQHESVSVGVQQVIEVVREARGRSVELCVICLTAPLSREGKAYLETVKPETQVATREQMIRLAGAASPATDEDLRELGKRSGMRRTLREWALYATVPEKAKRYFWYGTGLSAIAFVTGEWYYPIPAVFCLTLFIACKRRKERSGRQD